MENVLATSLALSERSHFNPRAGHCEGFGAGTLKFYVTIPVTDVGVLVLEQVIVIENEMNESTGVEA